MCKLCWWTLWSTLLLILAPVACQKSSPPFECTDVLGCVDIAPDESVKIGVLQALSGGAAPIGTEQLKSIQLALAQCNNELLGHPIELQIEDEHCSPEGGKNAALKVVTRPGVVAILGTTCSGSAVTASKIVSEAGFVMISGSNGAPSLTSVAGKPGADWQSGYFRAMYNAAKQGKVAAIFAFKELGITKAATINDGDALPLLKDLQGCLNRNLQG